MAETLRLADALVRIVTDSSGVKAGLADVEKQVGHSLSGVERSLAEGFINGTKTARENMGSLAETAGAKFGQVAQFIASPVGAVLGLGAVIGAFTVSATKAAIELEDGFERIPLILNKSAESVEHLKEKILAITPSMASAKQEAEGLANILAAGFGEEAGIKILDTAAKLSRVTGTDLNNSIELLTNTMNAYGLSADEAGRVSNILFGAFRTAGGPQAVNELTAALGRIIPIASELGIPLEQVVASIAAFRVQTGNTTRAAMGLANILLTISSNAQKFRDEGVNIQRVISEGGLIGALNALRTISRGNMEDLKAMGIEGRTAAAVFALTGEKADLLKDKMAEIVGSGSDVNQALKTLGGGYKQSVLELTDAWDDFKVSFGTLTVPPLTAVLKAAVAILKGDVGGGDLASFVDVSTLLEEAGKKAVASAGSISDAVREKTTQAVEQRVMTEKDAIAEMSSAERASYRERIEATGKMWQENLAVSADARMKDLTGQKQLADASKSTALELLQFDRRILEEQFRTSEEKLQARISTIKQELPLLTKAGGDEKKLREQLQNELRNLERQGVTERATLEGSLTTILAKETQTRKQLAEQEFQHRSALGKTSLQEEIAHHEAVARAAKTGSDEQLKALETAEQKKKELREGGRTSALGVVGEVAKRLEEKGITDASLTDVQREWMQMMKEQGEAVTQVGFGFTGGRTVNLGELQGALEGAGKLEQGNALLQKFGNFKDLFQSALQTGGGSVTDQLGLTFGDSSAAMLAALASPITILKQTADEVVMYVENRFAAGGTKIGEIIRRKFKDELVRDLIDEANRL
jgi:TP901 family phage tail tape measure protein